MNTFGDRLRQLRIQSKKRVIDLAKEIGISIQAWTDYEKNRSMPQVDKLILISRYFKISIDYLLFGNKLEFLPPTIDEIYYPYINSLSEMIKKDIIRPKQLKNISDNVVFESDDEYIKIFVLTYLKINNSLKSDFSKEDICNMVKAAMIYKKR